MFPLRRSGNQLRAEVLIDDYNVFEGPLNDIWRMRLEVHEVLLGYDVQRSAGDMEWTTMGSVGFVGPSSSLALTGHWDGGGTILGVRSRPPTSDVCCRCAMGGGAKTACPVTEFYSLGFLIFSP